MSQEYSYQPTLQFTSWSSEIDKFIAIVLASGLAGFATLQAACVEFDTNRTDENAVRDLARHLVARHVLTEWQSDKLLSGKYKGFYIDDYCLLMQIGKGETTSTYMAKEGHAGRRLALVVTPPMIAPWVDGRPIYQARELTSEERERFRE